MSDAILFIIIYVAGGLIAAWSRGPRIALDYCHRARDGDVAAREDIRRLPGRFIGRAGWRQLTSAADAPRRRIAIAHAGLLAMHMISSPPD